MIVPTMRITSASRTRSQLSMTRPIVTWFFCTIAPMETANVKSRTIPRINPADIEVQVQPQDH